jgi:hypothetical protein
MKKIVLCMAVVCASLSLSTPAWATWGKFISAGSGLGIGSPSCAQVADDQVACAVLSGTATMMVNVFNGKTWGKWTSIAGTVSSSPFCTSDGDGNVFCAATTAGGLEEATFNGSKWSAPVTIKGTLYSAPSCANFSAGQVVCVARNSTGGLSWTHYNGSAWSAFATLKTSTVSPPSCTSDDNGGAVCSVYTTANQTLVTRFNGTTWAGFLNVGGTAGGVPDCTAMNSGGKVACFAKAYNSGIYASVFNGGAWTAADWTGYAGISGNVNDNASCTSQAAGELVCGAIGALDSAFYANVYNGANWSGWAKIGTTGWASPACAALGTGQVVCLVTGINNKLSSTVGP